MIREVPVIRLFLCAVIVPAALVGSCQRRGDGWPPGAVDQAETTATGVPIPPNSGWYVATWKDPVTGCEYLLRGVNGIIPRRDHLGQKGCRD